MFLDAILPLFPTHTHYIFQATVVIYIRFIPFIRLRYVMGCRLGLLRQTFDHRVGFCLVQGAAAEQIMQFGRGSTRTVVGVGG